MKFVSLKWKISGILVISNLMLGLLLVFIVNNTVSESLSKELIERGKTIAANLAQYSAEQIYENDAVALRELIEGNINFESVEYILILDSEGSVLADNYNQRIPAELSDFDKDRIQEKIAHQSLIHFVQSDVFCYDIWVAVAEGYLGYIRVGMKRDYIVNSVRETNIVVIATIIGITLIGIIIVLFLANRIIRPIIYLTHRADEISQGKLEEKVQVKTRDEIESLGQALERLRESVKIALDRLKRHQTLRM